MKRKAASTSGSQPRHTEPDSAIDPTTAFLFTAVGAIAARVARLIDGGSPEPFDLVPPAGSRLAELVRRVGLRQLDVGVLLAALAPALDRRFGPLYAGLGERPEVSGVRGATALALAGGSAWDPADRRALSPDGLLCRASLIAVNGGGGPLLDDVVHVPERVVRHLLGDDAADPSVAALMTTTVHLDADEAVAVARALAAGDWVVWMNDRSGGGLSFGATALAVVNAPAVVLDLGRLPPSHSLADVLPAACREAVLLGGGVVAGPVDQRRDAAALAAITPDPLCPVILSAPTTWDPRGSTATPVLVEVPRIDPPARQRIWARVLDELGVDLPGAAAELSLLRLSPEQIQRTSLTAAMSANAAGVDLDINHLRAAAMTHGSSRLMNLARRVVPRATFDDLVAPPELLAELRSLPDRHRTRHRVREEWGLGRTGGRGLGLTCLFAGPPGTGKTLSAEVLAAAIGVDLFIVDLSQIVDKYIGETEKNLERVFVEAESVNGVLLFDEADALFGKRSDVKSSHDRHANVEVAYLLQRMEDYDGIAVLTTNLRGNIDEAFSRRLDVIIGFVDPGPEERLELWRRHLPPTVPVADDLDLALLAEHLTVSGGLIRNVTISAAHAAAIGDRPICMRDLVKAAEREYRNGGRLFKVPALARWAGPAE